MGRPDWWPDWLPERDSEGHLYDDGVSKHWMHCDCPGASGGGHHIWRCRINGCRAEPVWPPEHTGPARDQR